MNRVGRRTGGFWRHQPPLDGEAISHWRSQWSSNPELPGELPGREEMSGDVQARARPGRPARSRPPRFWGELTLQDPCIRSTIGHALARPDD